jgi:hypothetical protein
VHATKARLIANRLGSDWAFPLHSAAIWKRKLIMRAARTYIAVIVMTVVAVASTARGQLSNPPTDNGQVAFFAAPGNEIVSLTTKLVVPAKLAEPADTNWTLFLWPGLQPRLGGANYWPIGNGVLQPVLTWGPSCAPEEQPKRRWWISAQYVNTLGNYMGYQGCSGGLIIGVDPKDTLLIDMSLFRSIWTQTILNQVTKESTIFRASLADQAQGIARFEIEPYGGAISPEVVFLETTIRFAHPHPENCRLGEHGPDDVVTAPVIVAEGQSCYVEKIILKPPTRPRPAKSLLRPR